MPTLVTPSAKSHERVTGRWIRDIQAESRKDWLVYYTKQVFGTPIPWLFQLLILSLFASRAALEIASWSVAALTFLYIAIDRFAKPREFAFFRIGADFPLWGYVATGIAGVLISLPEAGYLTGIGSLRWVLLCYMFGYYWELFPGLNRAFKVLIGASVVCAGYALWQHFTGMDPIRGEQVSFAPMKEHSYFVVRGFFNSPEILGTLLAMVLPFPAAAFLDSDERRTTARSLIGAAALTLFLGLAVFWTYRPGLWVAAGAGLFVLLILHNQRRLALLATIAAFFAGVISATYTSPDRFLDQLQGTEQARAVQQRQQINEQVKILGDNIWVGAGLRGEQARNFDSSTGNVYFQILAETGALGLGSYFLFILGILLSSYQLWREIPVGCHWHRVLVSGMMAGQVVFHAAGLYWFTVSESQVLSLFVLFIGTIGYISEHYRRGLVPDDQSL